MDEHGWMEFTVEDLLEAVQGRRSTCGPESVCQAAQLVDGTILIKLPRPGASVQRKRRLSSDNQWLESLGIRGDLTTITDMLK